MQVSHALLVAVASLAPTPAPAVEEPVAAACLASGPGVESLIAFARYHLTSTDPGMDVRRASLGFVGIDTSAVSLITDARTCDRAVAAINTLASTPSRARELYVVKVGSTRFFVQDPLGKAGEHNPVYLFDSEFTLLKILLGL